MKLVHKRLVMNCPDNGKLYSNSKGFILSFTSTTDHTEENYLELFH